MTKSTAKLGHAHANEGEGGKGATSLTAARMCPTFMQACGFPGAIPASRTLKSTKALHWKSTLISA